MLSLLLLLEKMLSNSKLTSSFLIKSESSSSLATKMSAELISDVTRLLVLLFLVNDELLNSLFNISVVFYNYLLMMFLIINLKQKKK
jgi:hypothetical protein